MYNLPPFKQASTQSIMWFKNLLLYRFTETFKLSESNLEEKLLPHRFRACGSLQEFSYGWVSPLGRQSELLVHSCNGFLMMCACREEKILPASVVNEIVAERAAEIEGEQGRSLGRKERERLRDEVIHELMPRAFSRSIRTYAYIDPRQGYLVVDATSSKKAEELLSLLRESLGSLSVTMAKTNDSPSLIMTDWLSKNSAPSDLSIENECELRSPDDESSAVRCKNHDLSSPEIQAHLKAGKEVIKLAVSWNDRLSFILDDTLGIKRLRFLDLVLEQAAEIDTDDEAQRFDADFSIMNLELAEFFPRLLEIFGGESK